ncbi:Hypothetical protein NTJ_03538 [Nesidiocoris tenuis]|nr:Hypothetical protein NTJ_03538 [Nesidiocoris tenuis]
MVAGIAAFDGYSEVVDLLNHRWTDTCNLFPILEGWSIPHPMLKAIGPCQADLEVVKLPPKYQPNWILNADCAPGCLRRNCSTAGSKPYSCQQVRREVYILDQDGRPQSFTISLGCLCTELPSRFAEYLPPFVS